MNNIPEKLINFKVYQDSNDLLGMADVQLPSLEAMTETVKGAGIAGEVESPVLGHFGPMGLTLNWHTPTPKTMALSKQKAHHLELRGAIQIYDAAGGVYKTAQLKVVVKAVPKKLDLGKLDVGAKTDTSNEFECNYIKVWHDGTEKIEIDKFNFICKIDGEDYLAEVREALGM